MSVNRALVAAALLAACKDGSPSSSNPAGDIHAPIPDPPEAGPCAITPLPGYANVNLEGGLGAFIELYVHDVDPTKGDLSVTFTGAPAIMKGLSDDKTKLTIVVPPGAVSGPLTLRLGCATYVGPTHFIVNPVPAPVITGVSSNSVARGQTFEIIGANFTGVSGLFLGAPSAMSYKLIDDTRLRVLMPVDATGGNIHMSSTSGNVTSDIVVTATP